MTLRYSKPLRVGLVVVWGVAAAAKALSFNQFADFVNQLLPMVRGGWENAFAATITVGEFGVAALLASRYWPLGASASLVLFTTFAGVHVARIINHVAAPCACLGPLFQASPTIMIAICLVLATASLILALQPLEGATS